MSIINNKKIIGAMISKTKFIGAIIAALMIGAALTAISALNMQQAMAQQPPGKLAYKFNIIGTTDKNFSPGAEDGNGRRIFIPLKTDNYVDPCSTTGGQNNPDTSLVPTKGVKINVSAGDFNIVDGNAVPDKYASFTMPAALYDVYIVGKGKPGGCADIEAYTTLSDTLYFIGSVDIDRTTGKPKWTNVSNLLYGPNGEIYFADPYQDYFWQIYNNGMRNMEVRFYEVTP